MLRLIRPLNLVIVAFTQYLLEFLILVPVFEMNGIAPILDMPRFLLLVTSTVLIAAGGYVINDIEDVEIDRINKPEKQIVSQSLSVRSAWIYYFSLFIIGFIISLYLAIYINNLPLLGIYPAAWILLALYSKYFKKMPLIGNLTVAFFCAFVAGIVWFAERDAYFSLANTASQEKIEGFEKLTIVFGIYMFFAFITTLYRELIKDMEDYQGDAENGCRTLPIVLGMKMTKAFTFLIGIIFLVGLYFLSNYFMETKEYFTNSLIFIGLAMFFPLLYSLYLIFNSKEKKDFKLNSRLAKVMMLSGILLLFFL